MSDDNDKQPEVKLDAGGGFMPDPAPRKMTAEEAGVSPDDLPDDLPAAGEGAGKPEIALAGVQPDGSVAVPQDTARRALEAVQILVENNRAASQQLESLMGIVLDAAEVANRSASAVATTGGHVNRAAEKLIEGAQRQSMQAKLVLGIAGAVLVGSAGLFSFMSVQLQNKVAQVDEMMLAVGKRAVDLKRRMETMDDIHTALEDLKLAQENTQSVQQAIEERIARLQDTPRPPPKPEPEPKAAAAPKKAEPSPEMLAARKAEAQAKAEAARAEAAKAEAANKQLLQQLTTLDGMLKDQAKAVKDLSGQFGALQGSVANVDGVRKDVEALAAQQRLREKELAQELAAEKARREKELKDKDRELIRERERAREREAAKERELAREREAAKEKLAAAEREAEKQRMVSYRRDQSKPSPTPADAKVPSFTASGGSKAE